MNRASYRKGFILVMAVAISGLFLYMINDFLIAVLLAAIFAALLYPLYRWMMRAPFLARRPGLTAAGTVMLATVALGLPFAGFVGLVSAQAAGIAASLVPWLQEQFTRVDSLEGLTEWLPYHQYIEPYRERIVTRLGEAAGELAGFFVRSGTALTKGTLRLMLNLFVMLYAMYFFLCHGPRWLAVLAGYLPLSDHDRTQVLERGVSATRATLKSILIIGVMQGALVGLAFWVLGIGGAIFWGTVVVILSALPAVGPPVVWIPAAVYLLLNGQTLEAVGLTLWGALVIGLLDNVLRPRIIGAETSLPDLLIFLSMLGGIGMFGVLGLIIGPIIAAVMMTVLEIYRYAFIRELPSESG